MGFAVDRIDRVIHVTPNQKNQSKARFTLMNLFPAITPLYSPVWINERAIQIQPK